jgi:hypothetical protein
MGFFYCCQLFFIILNIVITLKKAKFEITNQVCLPKQ